MKKILLCMVCFCNLSAMFVPEPGDQGQPLVTTIVLRVFDTLGACTRHEDLVVRSQLVRSKGYSTVEQGTFMWHPAAEITQQKEDITQ